MGDDNEEPTSNDQILRGFLTLKQPQNGYRFNLDAILLADFVQLGAKTLKVADFCAGVGTIGLLIAKRFPRAHVTLLEVQEQMAYLGQENIVQNQLEDRVQMKRCDLADPQLQHGGPYDVIVSCPPYFAISTGQSASLVNKATARQEGQLSLEQLISAAQKASSSSTVFSVVYPSDRSTELLITLNLYGFIAHKIRFVHTVEGQPAKRILLETKRNFRGGVKILPPWFIRDKLGNYTDEAHQLLEGTSW